MTAAELRAMTAQGPATILVSREDMLRLLDEREHFARIDHDNKRMAIFAIGSASLWMWMAIYSLLQWFGVL